MAADHARKKPDPCSFVIFGATGDLTHRLVIPALYNLATTNLLPEKFCVVGVARRKMSSGELTDGLMKGLRQFATRAVDDAIAKRLLECVTSIEGDPGDPASFDAMRDRLDGLEAARGTGGNRLFYLATPPDAEFLIHRYLDVIDMIAIPDRFEHAVGKTQHQDVLHGLLAEVMINPVDLVLVKQLQELGVQCPGGCEIGAERLFHH